MACGGALPVLAVATTVGYLVVAVRAGDANELTD
jgi:hypothetical protein